MYLYGFSCVFQGGKSFPFPSDSNSDKVWLSSENIKMASLTKKLDYKWFSPYTIECVISHSVY